MKFQVFLIGLVVAMTAGAIMVAQSVPVGYSASAPGQVKVQIPPAAASDQAPAARAEPAVVAPALTPARIVETPVEPLFVAVTDPRPAPQVVAARAPKAAGANQAQGHGKAHDEKNREHKGANGEQDD